MIVSPKSKNGGRPTNLVVKPSGCSLAILQKTKYLEMTRLNEKKAKGIENTPAKFIKMTAPFTRLLLSDIFNKCALDGVFPLPLKIAKVTPIFKNGSQVKATNYRPISILSPFSKIFEKIIYNRLNKYFS